MADPPLPAEDHHSLPDDDHSLPHDGHDPNDDDVLGAGNVLQYLASRGLQPKAGAVARPLGGGVSNIVLAVGEGPGSMVVKQALARLRVADAWWAPRERALVEAEALDLAGRLTPGAVPRVLDRDPGRCALVVERAPADWQDWKSRLLSGTADARVAAWLGSLLAGWHRATLHGQELSERFYSQEPFEALRVEPYYRTVARRRPPMAGAVLAFADELLSHRLCLVHGDFSPKNVLVGRGRELWVIDFEVAHLGDPAFDVAFMLCHLMLKSLHRPELAPAYDRCALAFASAYEAGVGMELAPSWDYVLGHVGCLVMARVDGKSPAEYLSEGERRLARQVGELLVTSPPGRPEGLARLRRQAAPSHAGQGQTGERRGGG
ncbi:MAG TPA: aminoglycoside phosphotransferase family protein [Acidimicrobiales bacterium]|nr:aminoglycoside phosphotransferase family protein [Acidimicrobiales bacterium]